MAVHTPTAPPASPTPTPTPPRRRWGRRVPKVLLGGVAWAVFLFFVVFATVGLFWVALPFVMLHSRPSGQVFVITFVVLAFVVGLYLLVSRFVTRKSIVRWVAAGVAALTMFACLVWAPTHYDDTVYVARAMAWGESDVHDYQKFPSRMVATAAPVFHFQTQLTPDSFRTIQYEVNGQVKSAPFDQFLRDSDTTSFIVIKDGLVRYENYFNGYSRDSIVTSFSTVKSFVSAMIGTAIAEGRIGSVNDPVITYVPELRGRGLDRLTIRELLTMSTGVRFVYDSERGLGALWPFGDEAQSYMHPDLRHLVEGLPASAEPPGAAWKYNPYNTILLGLILERTTHEPVAQYLSERLWQPLGMEFPGSWSTDSTNGFEKMESGLNGRAIDFAKFGQLFLDNGMWNGKQVVPAQWVAESTTPDPADHRPWLIDQDWKNSGGYYKYQWWGKVTPDGTYRYAAVGHLGQVIAVFPQSRTVIARFGTSEGGVAWDDVTARIAANLK